MFNRNFFRAIIVGALIALLAVGGYALYRAMQPSAPEPIPDYDPATLAGGRAQLTVPYVSTEYDIVREMLNLGGVAASDLVVDLGSGDGRIPILAARDKGARGLGVDIDDARIRESRVNAAQAGVAERVSFRQQDLFATPLDEATVLTLYLLPEINLQLRPRILAQMRPGARVVSNSFDMGDWRPERQIEVQGNKIFLWIVPARVAGSWRVSLPGGLQGELSLRQRYQDVAGTLNLGGRSIPLREPQLRGPRIAFTVDLGTGPRRLEGRVDGGGLAGNGWQAVRIGGQ
jgi:SAM-dependent methyltransferase